MMRPLAVLAVSVLCLTCPLRSAETASADAVQVRNPATPPTLDGDLTDPCWMQADWQSGLREHADPDQPAKHDTRFAFITDGESLFMAATMIEPATDRLVARAERRDAHVYRDDCIQLFIDPNRTDTDYFTFSVNSRGTVRDTKGKNIAWNAEIRAMASVSAATWCVEIEIPLCDLELAPGTAATPWGFNLTRVRRAGAGAELSTFARIRGTFHQPTEFRPLHLPSEMLRPYLWHISAPDTCEISLVESQPALQTRIQIGNATGRFRFFHVQAGVRSTDTSAQGQPVRDGLDDGDQHFVALSTPTAGLEQGMLVVSVTDALHPERVYARRQFPARLAYSPIRITLTAPWYKNAIFATQDLATVECDVQSDLPEEQLSALTLVGRLWCADRAIGAPVRRAPARRMASLSLSVSDLPVGSYTLVVALMDRAGNTVHQATTPLRKLPPHEGEVRFDRNMACLVDGKPFLPFGWFGVRMEQMEAFAKDGCNTIGAYGPTCTSLSDADVKAYLDRAHKLGLKVLCRPQPSLAIVRSAQRLLTDDETNAIRELVRKWRDHPALLGWYMCDEPEGHAEPLERRLQEYRIVAEEDPFHPAIVLNNTVPGIHKYHLAGDLLMPDVYPGFLRAGGASRIKRPTDAMVACREATDGRKPVWVTPQGHIQMVDGHRAPTFRELRNQAWQCVAHDAMGLFWYRDSFVNNLVHTKVGMPYIQRELRAVLPAVRTKSVPNLVRTNAKAGELSVGAKQLGQHLLIIAVSLSTTELAVEFTVDGLGNTPLTVLSEARRIMPNGGRFSDLLKPYEAHVYSTDTRVPPLPSIAQIEKAIDAEIDARCKPGNLAYFTTGARVNPQHHDGQSYFLHDGSVDGVFWPREWGKVSHPLPNWIDVVFPKPTRVARVAVYSSPARDGSPVLQDAAIQIQANGIWRTVADVANCRENPATFTFKATETNCVRLLVTRAQTGRIRLQEIEVYAE